MELPLRSNESDKPLARVCDLTTFEKTGEGWNDPVHRHMDGSWHFCDETWTDCVGPYATKEECWAKLKEYVATYLNGDLS